MVHAYRTVELTISNLEIQGITGKRPIDLDALQLSFFNGRCDNLDFLCADSTTVTSVGIERRDGDPRVVVAGSGECLVCQDNGVHNAVDVEFFSYVFQWDM